MAVRIVPARQAAVPPEHVLWVLQRGDRRAVALVRQWPHGDELVISVDGHLHWSKLFRGDAATELERESAEKHQALCDTGWV